MTPDPAQLVGQVFDGRYRVVRPIASGGMATVFEGERVDRPGDRCAIKVLHASHGPVALQRFQREAQITSELAHEHIVKLHDFHVGGSGVRYLVMELLEGEDLAARIRRTAPMALDRVVHIVRQVALGLDAAHRAGIVHRDLKPQNIFLCRRDVREDFVKLLDFGVSKFRDSVQAITSDNTIPGTPNYMSPEQADGLIADVDERTDVFALGVVTWEMLAARRAFEAPTVSGTLYQVVHLDPLPILRLRPELPRSIETVLEGAMAKAKKARYPNVMMLADALADAARTPFVERVSTAATTAGSDDAPTTIDLQLNPAAQAQRKILFVDDSPSMCALVSTWLMRAGYEVEVAHDGVDGGARVRDGRPDLVIADVSMPRCDGFSLCRSLKDDPATHQIPVILFTRLDEATDVVNGLAAGVDAFVVKGSSSRDLLRQVDHLLPDPHVRRRQTPIQDLASFQSAGRAAVFKRLFDACFREVPFDVLAVIVDRIAKPPLLLLGSHYELARDRADDLTARVVEAFAAMRGRSLVPSDLEARRIVIDETARWGAVAIDVKRQVIVPMLDGDDVIGCLAVFSFENQADLDANTRFFFDIGVAAARALRRPQTEAP